MALIPPVGARAVVPIQPSVVGPAGAGDPAAAQRGGQFGEAVGRALDQLDTAQLNADRLARDAAVGRLENVEEYMLAATEAQLATQLTVAVRNRAVEAFNEIMRMQV